MIWQYIRRLARFAFTAFAVRTDLINGLVSAVISLLIVPKNKAVAVLTTHDVALYAAMALGAYIIIRAVVVAPYRLWKEDQNKIAAMQAELDMPGRALRAAMQEHSISLRKDLSTKLAGFVGTTVLIGSKVQSELQNTRLKVINYENHIVNQLEISRILQELSYDPIVRTSVWNLLVLCTKIGQSAAESKDTDQMVVRLKKQAKLTFKILHCDGITGELGAFAELTNYLTEVGDPIVKS